MERKTALVTGASRGIGKAVARELGAQGYDLVLTCIHSIGILREYCDLLSAEYGIRCTAFQGDMGDPDSVWELFAGIRRLDVLVNNAGISYIGLLQDMSVKDWRRIMAVNTDSCFYTCRLAIPLMIRAGQGRILNVSSVWGSVGASMEAAYSASKGAVNSLTKALAKELAPSGIQVNALACGAIDTDMNRCFNEEDMRLLIDEIPADRLGTAGEAAQLAVQILHAPAYLTGQVITMDGGWI